MGYQIRKSLLGIVIALALALILGSSAEAARLVIILSDRQMERTVPFPSMSFDPCRDLRSVGADPCGWSSPENSRLFEKNNAPGGHSILIDEFKRPERPEPECLSLPSLPSVGGGSYCSACSAINQSGSSDLRNGLLNKFRPEGSGHASGLSALSGGPLPKIFSLRMVW